MGRIIPAMSRTSNGKLSVNCCRRGRSEEGRLWTVGKSSTLFSTSIARAASGEPCPTTFQNGRRFTRYSGDGGRKVCGRRSTTPCGSECELPQGRSLRLRRRLPDDVALASSTVHGALQIKCRLSLPPWDNSEAISLLCL